jgi:hypothetical protein
VEKSNVVLAVGDQHFPFQHKDTLAFLRAVKKEYKPTICVNMGDEADMAAMSDYDHDPDGYSPGDELTKTIEKLEEMYELFPKMYVCTSNHTSRPFRRAYKFGIPRAYLRDYREFLKAPKGWEWRDAWEFDGVKYQHGDVPGVSGPQGALKLALKNMQSSVIGHIHSHAGILFDANPKALLFGFNVGCLIDREAYAFAYGKSSLSKPIIGVGIVEAGVPKFLPMKIGKGGRWTKEL